MRIGELVTGLRYMVTNEQRSVFDLLKEMGELDRKQLDERTMQLADQMHSQGLINRQFNEETQEIKYSLYKR